MHRIQYTKLTPEQILGKLPPAANGPTSASPLADVFAGNSLRIVLDNGPVLGYRFADGRRLSLTEGDAAPVQAGYGALTLDRIALFSHMSRCIPRRRWTPTAPSSRWHTHRAKVSCAWPCPPCSRTHA
jgi:hypothetical protein